MVKDSHHTSTPTATGTGRDSSLISLQSRHVQRLPGMEYHHHEETNSSFHDAFNPTMHTKTETKPPHRGAITKHFTPTSRKKICTDPMTPPAQPKMKKCAASSNGALIVPLRTAESQPPNGL